MAKLDNFKGDNSLKFQIIEIRNLEGRYEYYSQQLENMLNSNDDNED